MAKSKSELLDEAQRSGKLPEDASPDDFSAADLEGIVSGNVPVYRGSLMHNEPQIAPDGHVNLSQEDIDARS